MNIKNNQSLNGIETEGTEQPFDPEEILKSVEVDPYADIAKPETAIEVHTGEKISPSFTLGNFSTVIGKAKSRKTFLLTVFLAVIIIGGWIWDFIKCVLPTGKNFALYFDSEQSSYHLNRAIKRAIKLSGKDAINFKAYGLRKFKPSERLALIEYAIYHTPNLGIVFIDGIRDLVTSINDEEQATELTSKLLKWTAELNIHIVTVLHQNKGDANARGHLGSEAINKGETTLSVTVDNFDKDVSIVSCEMSRDLPFADFAFRINEEGLPEVCDLPEKSITQQRQTNPQKIDNEKHWSVLNEIYKANPQPNHAELRDAIIYGFGDIFGQSKCRSFIAHYIQNEWIEKDRDKQKVIYKYKRAIF